MKMESTDLVEEVVGYLLYEPQGVFNSKYENVVSLISLSLSLDFLHYPLSFSILVGVIQKPYQRLKGHYDLSSWFIMFHIIPSTLILSCILLQDTYFPHIPPPPLTRTFPHIIPPHPTPADPQIQFLLLPPPLRDPQSRTSLRFQEKVQNRSC